MYQDEEIDIMLGKALSDKRFKAGKEGTIISYCPHTEPFKTRESSEALLYVVRRLAKHKNLMQLATKQIIPDYFIEEACRVLYDGQLTAFISISSFGMQKFYEPYAESYHERLKNIGKLKTTAIKSCLYLKPFLFSENETEQLIKVILDYVPDAVCVGSIYKKIDETNSASHPHPTENDLYSFGVTSRMKQFREKLKGKYNGMIHFTSTCVIANMNGTCNMVPIPEELCIKCNTRCAKLKWEK